MALTRTFAMCVLASECYERLLTGVLLICS